MALLLENTKQVEFQTDLRAIATPFQAELKALHWILAHPAFTVLDFKKNGTVDKLDHNTDLIYFTGAELWEMIETRKIQFTWGIFIGTTKKLETITAEKIPELDGNDEIWTMPDTFFAAESVIEICCFDSSATMLKFRDTQLEARWQMKFTDAQKIQKY